MELQIHHVKSKLMSNFSCFIINLEKFKTPFLWCLWKPLCAPNFESDIQIICLYDLVDALSPTHSSTQKNMVAIKECI